jgi:hypothetical protein
MAVQLRGIHKGMEVYGSDGGRVGKVVEVTQPAAQNRMEDSLGESGRTLEPMTEAPRAGAPIGGDLNVTPLGTTTPKGRGKETAASMVQHRADPHNLPDSEARAERAASGVDVMRGYGPDAPRAAATDALAPVQQPDATPVPGGGQQEGSILVTYRGLLGLDSTMLRVPFDAVREVTADGERLVLAYPREECHQRFGGYDETQGPAGADADARG